MQGNWRQKYLRYKSYLLNTVDRYEERKDVRIYLEILLSLATISIFAVFALRPTLLTIAELIKEIEAKEELVGRLDNKIDNITTAQVLYDRERENIELLKRSIPKEAKTDYLIYQLEGLVEKNELRIQRLTINEILLVGNKPKGNNQKGNNNEKSDSDFIDFDIQVTGSYTKLYSFISDMELLLSPIEISSTTILQREDQETEQLILSLSLSGKIPYHGTANLNQGKNINQ